MEVDSRNNNHQSLQDHPPHHDSDHYLVMHNKTLKCVCELCTCGNYPYNI